MLTAFYNDVTYKNTLAYLFQIKESNRTFLFYLFTLF